VALAHGNRGRRPPNAIDPDVAERVIELAATSYCGLTLSRMTMALAEQHGIDVSRASSRASLHRILRRAAATGRVAGGPPDAVWRDQPRAARRRRRKSRSAAFSVLAIAAS
jgi:hypothetical protein